MTTTRPLVLDARIELRCTKTDKDAMRAMAKRLGCDDASDAFRKLARWLSTTDDGVIKIVRHQIES